MLRQSALLRLHDCLLARKADLRRKLAGELANLRDFKGADATGDSADAAFEAGSDEISALLAELDDRELSQIDRALTHWNQGTYGKCESCRKSILLSRLNALPYTPFCIGCEREMEKHSDGLARQSTGQWAQVFDPQMLMQEQGIQLACLIQRRGLL